MPYAVDGYKVCSACRENKPVSEFRKNRAHRDGLGNQCKVCHRASDEKFIANNPEYAATFRRKYTLRKRYNLSLQEYDAMMEAAGGVCEVCGREPDPGANLDVDHDHQTGKVRGLLCWRCNRAMGMVSDTPGILRALADYLDKHLASDIIPDGEYFY